MSEDQARKILLCISIIVVALLMAWQICGFIEHLTNVTWVLIAE